MNYAQRQLLPYFLLYHLSFLPVFIRVVTCTVLEDLKEMDEEE
jgi:hypothetical protein